MIATPALPPCYTVLKIWCAELTFGKNSSCLRLYYLNGYQIVNHSIETSNFFICHNPNSTTTQNQPQLCLGLTSKLILHPTKPPPTETQRDPLGLTYELF